MIVLDTNVISALMQQRPDPSVVSWLDRQPPESIWITSITVFEIRFGIEQLVRGRRRRQIEEAFALALTEEFEGRVLAFDEGAAQAAGAIGARQRRRGRPVEMRDTQIAGIVLFRRGALATRNVRHFEGLGLSLIDPWSSST